MIQTVTYNELDNMFFETLRRAVVAAGYIPDIADYQSSTEAQNALDYKNAKATLRNTVPILTEIFGVGSFESKGEKTINKIVIVRGNKRIGSIGGWPAHQYDSTTGFPLTVNTKFKKSFTPDNSNDVEYQVKLITNDPVWDNTLSAIIDNVIPQKRFLFTVDDAGNYTTKAVLIMSMGDFNVSAYNFMERTFKFVVKDIFLQIPQTLKTNIPVLTTVEFMTYLQMGVVDQTIALPPTEEKTDRSITVWVRTSPDVTKTINVGRGLTIPAEYPVGTTIVIPYLVNNNTVQSPIFVSSKPYELLKCVEGVIDMTTIDPVSGTLIPDDYVTFTFEDYV